MRAPALAVMNLQVRILKGLAQSYVLSLLNFIISAINMYTRYTKSYENSFCMITSVFCLVCIQISSSFPTNSTKLSCSASLEIPLSWGWKLHLQSPTTEPCPEVSECSPGHLPLLVQNGFGACLYNICSLTLSHVFSYLQGFLSFQNIFSSCSCIRLRPQSHRRQINGSDVLKKKVCSDWYSTTRGMFGVLSEKK